MADMTLQVRTAKRRRDKGLDPIKKRKTRSVVPKAQRKAAEKIAKQVIEEEDE